MKDLSIIKIKFFLTGIFVVVACVSLNAQITTSPYIFIGKDVAIAGEEYLFVRQDTLPATKKAKPSNIKKKPVKIKEEASPPAQNHTNRKKPAFILLPLPFTPSPYYFSQSVKGAAVVVPQQRISDYYPECKIIFGKTYLDIENSDSPLCSLEQRKKFTPTATQCGILTSFGPNSPSLS